ncbi:hypothetical protein [Psychrobacillus sp.]|nr:hypothetical protein [Psychrobacillus sp.]
MIDSNVKKLGIVITTGLLIVLIIIAKYYIGNIIGQFIRGLF